MSNNNSESIGFWGMFWIAICAFGALSLIGSILFSPFDPVFQSIEEIEASIEEIEKSIEEKHRFEMRIMQAESRKEFNENGQEMTISERQDFCKKWEFDNAYSYSTTSITCEFEYEAQE